MAQKPTPDDLWIFVYQQGSVRMRDLEHAFVASKRISRPTLYRYKKLLESEGKLIAIAQPGKPPYNTYSVPQHHHQAIEILKQANHFPSILGKRLEDIPWETSPTDFYITACQEKVLWTNVETGATMILLKSPADPRPADPLHIHPSANQWSFGLAGEAIDFDGSRWSFEGSTGFIPKGVVHGQAITTRDSLCLVFWDGPRTYVIVDQDHVNSTE
jgi:hypothetical protein